MKTSVPVIAQIDRFTPKRDGSSPGDPGLRRELHDQMMALSFRAFEQCITDLLTKLGYEQVRLTGRTAWRGRTHHGGREIEAYAQTGVTRSRVLVQIKQYKRPVQRRFVNELRGTMCLRRAAHGILIATSTFPDPARKAAAGDPRQPVILVDGSALMDNLCAARLGIRVNRGGHWNIDNSYFAQLNEHFPRTNRRGKRQRTNHLSGIDNAAAERMETEGGYMTWRTHVLAGTSSVWLLGLIPGALTLDTLGISLVAAAFGALLPDLDASDAKVRALGIGGIRPFVPLSEVVYRSWGHRGPLHSYVGLIGAAAVGIVFGRALSWETGLAFWLGYASHLATDACTKSGIPLLSVTSKGPRFHLLPPLLRFRTGSQAEEMLLPFLAVATALLVFTHLPH